MFKHRTVQKSDQRRLTGNPEDDSGPAWSPDGSWVAYSANHTVSGEVNSGIYLVKPDGSDLTALTGTPGGDAFPGWAPDGQQLAFMSYRDGRHGMYIMNVDGSAPTFLIRLPEGWLPPAWRPRP